MTDKELLELAAKAAAMNLQWNTSIEDGLSLPQVDGDFWNPLTDDGDALRLAVKLRLKVRYHGALGQALVDQNIGDKPLTVNVEDCDRDEFAATRRAIVRAAAEIGKTL